MGRNSHCTEVERQFVKKLRAEGKTYRYIANTLGRLENFVTNSLKKKCEKGNRGRPRLTGPAEDRRIVLMTKKDPFVSSRQIAAEMGLNISSRTIRRRLVDANLPGRKARRVPLLRKVHIQRRKAFANEHRDWCGPTGEKKWRNILFSDEVKMNLYGNDSKRSVRRPKGKEFASQYTKKIIKHGGGNIMVWGCFSWQGVGPLFWIKDTMTAVEYRDILQNVMLPYAEENMPLRWCYQQDNDPVTYLEVGVGVAKKCKHKLYAMAKSIPWSQSY